MKKIVLNISILLVTGFLAFCNGMTVNAKEEYTILEGIYADELDLSNLTEEEAKKKAAEEKKKKEEAAKKKAEEEKKKKEMEQN